MEKKISENRVSYMVKMNLETLADISERQTHCKTFKVFIEETKQKRLQTSKIIYLSLAYTVV